MATNKLLLEIKNVSKCYKMDKIEFHALNNVSFSIKSGEYVAIMGPSGSGKSTLMHIIGCLDQPSEGKIIIDGKDVSQAKERALAKLRNQKIGFVFQQFNLLRKTSALNNVTLPLIYARVDDATRKNRAIESLTRVGLQDKLKNYPSQLSGGQQQRVAIARALVNNPAIILADEPTGNLDSKSGAEVMKIFEQLNHDGHTIILVTHDQVVANHAKRIIKLADGKIIQDTKI